MLRLYTNAHVLHIYIWIQKYSLIHISLEIWGERIFQIFNKEKEEWNNQNVNSSSQFNQISFLSIWTFFVLNLSNLNGSNFKFSNEGTRKHLVFCLTSSVSFQMSHSSRTKHQLSFLTDIINSSLSLSSPRKLIFTHWALGKSEPYTPMQ